MIIGLKLFNKPIIFRKIKIFLFIKKRYKFQIITYLSLINQSHDFLKITPVDVVKKKDMLRITIAKEITKGE